MHTELEGIRRDEDGSPWIVGTNTKVVELVSPWTAHGGDAPEIPAQLPHLSVDQVEEGL